jgi:hypothetical protein
MAEDGIIKGSCLNFSVFFFTTMWLQKVECFFGKMFYIYFVVLWQISYIYSLDHVTNFDVF